MNDASLALARNQNESLEKSLQALRGKLVGVKNDKFLKKPGHFSKTTANLNDGVHNMRNSGERIDDISNIPQRQKDFGVKGTNKPSKPLSRAELNRQNSSQNSSQTDGRGIHLSEEQIAFKKYSNIDGNYFDDFRKKVNEIRKSRLDAAMPEVVETSGNRKSDHIETVTKDHEKWKAGEARQFLLTKIEQQNKCIDGLEAQVQELKLENQKLYKSQKEIQEKLHSSQEDRKRQDKLQRKELNNMEAHLGLKYQLDEENIAQAVSTERDQAQRERLMRMNVEQQLEQSKIENTQLRHRVSEIAERAHLLNSIHQQRVRILESKLKASMDVAKYYCDLLGNDWLDQPEDSTEEILFGPLDNTTLDLLRATPEFQEVSPNSTGKKSLRSYFLAILFMVRLKNDAENHKLWKPYFHSERVQGSGMGSGMEGEMAI